MKKVKSFRIAAAEYFGEPDGDPAERYDLWPERRILPVIRRIERRVELQINYWEDLGRRWLDVVDGQQRLTTLTLLLSAIRANVPAKEAEKLASNAAPSADNPRSVGPGRPNSAKPARDWWMARLVLIWRDDCGLPVENTKHLKGFLLDCLRPYPNVMTDRMAKHFVERWKAGKIDEPGPSLLRTLTDQ